MASPGVIWITGLSGVGKTTVAMSLRSRLVRAGTVPVLLDGDRIRRVLPDRLGHAEEDRRRLAATYGRLAGEIASQGHLVVCATVSLFHAVHEWNRVHLPGYLEVWLRAPPEALRERGARPALYGTGGVAGAAPHVVGVTAAAEFPLAADLVVDTTTTGPEAAADLIARRYAELPVVRPEPAPPDNPLVEQERRPR